MARTRTFQDWWNENKARKNAERRTTYRDNPVVRESRKAQALAHYRTKVRRERPIDRRSVVTEDGVRFMSIGRLARLIGRQIDSVRRYERTGVIPEPLYFDTRGWRLYTVSQAMLMRRVFRRFENKEDMEVKTLNDVAALLHVDWHTEVVDGE